MEPQHFFSVSEISACTIKRLVQQALALRYFYCGQDPVGLTAVISPIKHSSLRNEKARLEFDAVDGAAF